MAESLSENWRRGHSSIPEVEMANALHSLRKLVGALTEDSTINVGYTAGAQSYYAESGQGAKVTTRRLNISAQPITETPIPANMFDVLCGYTSHESSHHVNASTEVKAFNRGVLDHTRLGMIETIGEEVYCDSFPPGGSIAKQYIKIARDYHSKNDPPITDWSDLWRTWSAISIYNTVPDEWHPSIAKNLGVLLGLTQKLRGTEMSTHTRAYEYKRTLESLVFLEEKIKETPGWGKKQRVRKKLEPDDNQIVDPLFGRENRITVEEYDRMEKKAKEEAEAKALANQEDQKSEEVKEDEGGEGGCLGGLPYDGESNSLAPCINGQYAIDPKVAATIQKHLENSTSDVTDQVLKLLEENCDNGGNREMVPVLISNSDTEVINGYPIKTIQDLEWLRNLKLSLGHQTDRALERGQLDQSRLHMADVDGKVFKMRKPLPRKEQEIVLLIDASGSMRKGPTPYGSVNPLYDEVNAVWKVLGVPLYTYTNASDGGQHVSIKRLDNKGKVRVVETGGGTPSGAGLIGVALRHPKSTIIHFTDGEPNLHITPTNAMEAIAKHFPSIHVINIVYTDRDSIETYTNTLPNNTLVLLNSLDNFGRTLQSEIQKTLQTD